MCVYVYVYVCVCVYVCAYVCVYVKYLAYSYDLHRCSVNLVPLEPTPNALIINSYS